MLNDTKVIPARLIGVKEETGAKIEVLLLKRGADDVWETLVNRERKQDREQGSVLETVF